MEQKEEKIQNLMQNCVGVPDERFEEKEIRIAELEDKVESLEKEKFRLTQERATGGFPKSKDENEKILKDITK